MTAARRAEASAPSRDASPASSSPVPARSGVTPHALGLYADTAIELKRDASEIEEEMNALKAVFREAASASVGSPFVIERETGTVKVSPSGEKLSLKNPLGVVHSLPPKLYAELVEMRPALRKTAAEILEWLENLSPADQKAVLAEVVFTRGEHAVTVTPKKKVTG
jgi:hypothetical protein